MESILCDNNSSQEAIARARLQLDSLSRITSVITPAKRRPELLK